MASDLARRIARLEEAAERTAPECVRVVSRDVLQDPARLAAWEAEQRATLPAGAKLLTVVSGVPERVGNHPERIGGHG